MLTGFGKTTRTKAALALAVLYAFCVLAPATALALGDAAKSVHCLTKAHGAAPVTDHSAMLHDHGDAGHHQEDAAGLAQGDSGDEPDRAPGKCCGTFCIAGIEHEPTIGLIPPPLFQADYRALDDPVRSRGPDRIIRPPIA